MNSRNFSFFGIVFLALALVMGCSKETETVTIDSSLPDGTLSIEKSGSFTAQSGTPTTGTAEIGIDEKNSYFLHFKNDFTTEQGSGTVAVYFSTSMDFKADPGNGNPDLLLIGVVKSNGEHYYKFDSMLPGKFTHVILWCNTASIPFGYAALQ